jgi:hypothetical protein
MSQQFKVISFFFNKIKVSCQKKNKEDQRKTKKTNKNKEKQRKKITKKKNLRIV